MVHTIDPKRLCIKLLLWKNLTSYQFLIMIYWIVIHFNSLVAVQDFYFFLREQFNWLFWSWAGRGAENWHLGSCEGIPNIYSKNILVTQFRLKAGIPCRAMGRVNSRE